MAAKVFLFGEAARHKIIAGVNTLADAVELADLLEPMGAQMVREAALRTSERAGDGTTTAMVLAQAMDKAGREGAISIEEGLVPGAAGGVALLRCRPCIRQTSPRAWRPTTIETFGDRHAEPAPDRRRALHTDHRDRASQDGCQ